MRIRVSGLFGCTLLLWIAELSIAAEFQDTYVGQVSAGRATLSYTMAVDSDGVSVASDFQDTELRVETIGQRSVTVSYGSEGAGWGASSRVFDLRTRANPEILLNDWSDEAVFPLWPDLSVNVVLAIFDQQRHDPRVRQANEALLVGLNRIVAVQNGQINAAKNNADADTTAGETPDAASRPVETPAECTEESEEDWGASALTGTLTIPGFPLTLEGQIAYSQGKSECFDPPPAACEAAPVGGMSGSLTTSAGDSTDDCGSYFWDSAKIISGTLANHFSQDPVGCKAAVEDRLAMANADVKFSGASILSLKAGRSPGQYGDSRKSRRYHTYSYVPRVERIRG